MAWRTWGPTRAPVSPGRYYAEPVAIYVLEDGKARQVVYSPDFFNMPANHPLRTLKSAGFAGFRLMSRGGESDWLAYLGASYFRASDPNDQYGASARGLAINTGHPRISALHGLLAGAERRRNEHLRAAGEPERDGRLPYG